MTKPQVLKVLTIDDEPLILELISSYLKDEGYDVVCAHNGEEGLDFFSKEHFDLVLTDLCMPKMNGLEVLKNISNLSPDTPVIIVSGVGSIQDSINALRHGAWDYITKPLEYTFFSQQISKAIEQSKLRRENKEYYHSLEEQIKKRTKLLDKRTRELEEANRQLEEEIHKKEDSQNKLREAANLWQTTFDSMSDFISIHDKEHNIIRVNKSLAEFLKVKPSEIIGKECCKIYHCNYLKTGSCPHRQALELGDSHTSEHQETELGIPLQITTSPIINDGHLAGSVHIIKIISQ